MLITAYLNIYCTAASAFLLKSQVPFSELLAFGLSLQVLLFRALLNIAITLDLVPATGLVLPFGKSYSLLFTSLAIGIILSVSRRIEQNISSITLNHKYIIIDRTDIQATIYVFTTQNDDQVEAYGGHVSGNSYSKCH